MRLSRRDAPDAFGLSFLDVLACGLGAVALLFALAEMGVSSRNREIAAQIREMEGQAAVSNPAADLARQEKTVREMADRLETVAARGRPYWSLLEDAHRILFLLDVSGSMAHWFPSSPEFADARRRMLGAPGKWEETVGTIGRMLLAAPRLEGFAVLSISDDQAQRPCGAPLVGGEDVWIRPGWAAISHALDALRRLRPAGGAAHAKALDRALRYVQPPAGALGSPGADTIVVITDGLPNHGPVPPGATDPRVHPAGGDVLPASKTERATVVLDQLRQALEALPRARRPMVHVVCMPWPDDVELPAFALGLAGLTGGFVWFPPLPVPRSTR